MSISNEMKTIYKKAFIAGIFLGASAAFAFLIGTGCKEGDSVEMGPSEVVEAFNRAIAGGDFDKARSLCDTTSMKEYIENYIRTWETLQRQDSSAFAIASSLLSGSAINIEKTGKEGEARTVYYTIEAEGNIWKRKAAVQKEEGEWRVKEITDEI